MSQIKIRIEVDVYPRTASIDRIMQKLVNSNFRKVLENSSSYEFPLYDEKYSGNQLLDLLAEEVFYDEKSPFWGKKTKEEIRQYVITAGITPERIIEWVKNTLLTSNPSKAIQKIFELDPKEKRIIEKGEEYLKKYGHGMSIDDIESFENLDNSRLMVVRSQFGEYDLKVYPLKGGAIKDNDTRINHIKALYRYETSCPYFQARPVLYTTWVDMDDDLKYRTSNL